MRLLLIAGALLVLAMPTNVAFAAKAKKAEAKACSLTQCLARCQANRGRFCQNLCKRCS